MDLLQLRYFKELAERENITRTSQELRISAPSLSATISRLERDVGVPLFDRVGRNIILNENGKIMLRYANEIMSSLRNAENELHNADRECNKKIRLGISSSSLWLEAIEQFLVLNPDIVIQHNILTLSDMQNPSLGMMYDFVITASYDLPSDQWDRTILVPNDKPVLVVYPSHPFAKYRSVNLWDARNENFIALTKGTSSRKFFEDVCAKAGFSPNVVIECNYLLRSKLVLARFGIAFSSCLGSRASVLSGLKCVEVFPPEFERPQAILSFKKRHISPSALKFKEYLVDYYKGYK